MSLWFGMTVIKELELLELYELEFVDRLLLFLLRVLDMDTDFNNLRYKNTN